MKNYFSIGKVAMILAISVSLTQSSCRKEEDSYSQSAATNQTGDKSISPSTYDASVVMPWYALMNKLIIQSPGHTPPIAARDIGYTGVALYEATVGGRNGHSSLVGQLTALSSVPTKPYNAVIPTVIANATLARIIKSLFANATAANIATIDSLESVLDAQYSIGFPAADLTKSRDYGRALADAIFAWSSTDGGHLAYNSLFPASYVLPTGPDKWIPTPPAFSPIPMLPYWGNNRTFIAANSSPLINPPAPMAFSTTVGSDMYNAAYEVYTTGVNATQTQKDIATYWADGSGSVTPPGHLISITTQLIRNKNLNLRDAVILLAKVGIGLNDAGIVCWRAKYDNSLMRPVTYIRQNIDASWSSFIGTPPFPSFTSGHSSFSAATASILTKQFGAIAFTDSTKMPAFAPKTFPNFTSVAQEAALSRLYGGIHYRFDNERGFDCGEAIALNVRTIRF